MEGLKILQDTREQKPLKFKFETIKTCLNIGDYGAMFSDNYQFPVVFERKGIGDLFGTLSKGYTRFKKCIDRSKEQNIQIIIAIEGTKERVLRGYANSQRNGCSIVLQLETIKERYGVEHKYFKSRIEMANYITNFYQEHYKTFQEESNDRTQNI